MISRSTLVLSAIACCAGAASAQTRLVELGRLDHLPPEARAVLDVDAGDLDGDGRVDLVFLQRDAVVVLRGSRAGHFDETAREPLSGAGPMGGVAIVDIDGDGRLDVLFATHGGDAGLLRNLGAGSFDRVQTPVGGAVRGLVAGDVDGDGDEDVFVAVGNRPGTAGLAPRSRLYRNDAGNLVDVTTSQLPVETKNAGAAALLDVDGDGDLDLFLGMAAHYLGPPPQNELWRNDGTGTFTRDPNALPTDLISEHDLAFGDVDGDGDPDVVAPHEESGNPPWDRSVFLYRNDGTGTFALDLAAMPASESEPSNAVALADIDADGDLDLVVGGVTGICGGCRVLTNDGTGTFARASSWAAGDTPWRIVAADLDARPGRDILLGNVDGGSGASWRARLLLADPAVGFVDATEPRVFGAPSRSAYAALLTGDFDGDGDLDLVQSTGTATPPLTMHLNDGDGPTRDVSTTHLPATLAGTARRTARIDLDGDPRDDAWVVLQSMGTYRLTLLRAGPGGVLSAVPATSFPTVDAFVYAVESTDFDADGLPELVVHTTFGIEVWRGTAGLVWQVDTRPSLAPGLGSFAVGDVDGDGRADLVAKTGAHLPSDRIQIYLTDAGGVPTLAGEVLLPAPAVFGDHGVALADADGDGDRDLFVLSQTPLLYRNDGTGQFAPAPAGAFPIPAATRRDDRLVDIDLDGDVDVLGVRFTGTSELQAFVNDGRGAFRDATSETVGWRRVTELYAFELADADSDGDEDLWWVTPAGGVRVLFNLTRQAQVPWLHERGFDARLSFWSLGSTPSAPHAVLPALSLGTAHVAFPPLGVFRLDVATFIPLLPVTVPPSTGRADLDFVTPNDPNLAGLRLHVQATHLGPPGAPFTDWRFGNHAELLPAR